MHGIELKFMLHMRCNMDSKQKQWLHNTMIKHKQALANLVDFKLTKFEEICFPIKDLNNMTIRQLIMDLKTKNEETIFIAIERF